MTAAAAAKGKSEFYSMFQFSKSFGHLANIWNEHLDLLSVIIFRHVSSGGQVDGLQLIPTYGKSKTFFFNF